MHSLQAAIAPRHRRRLREARTRAQRPSVLPPLTPAGYLRLCRAAAGLSIEQVVERIEPRIAARSDVGMILRELERDGVKALSVNTLRPLLRAFPLDLEVYAQLRDEPADRHPRICRACGCSQNDACVDRDRCPCAWSDTPGLCTGCETARQ